MMINEQEQEFIDTSARNEKLERDYNRAKTQFENASKALQQNLKTKEDLFVKLQKVQTEIDQYTDWHCYHIFFCLGLVQKEKILLVNDLIKSKKSQLFHLFTLYKFLITLELIDYYDTDAIGLLLSVVFYRLINYGWANIDSFLI